MSLQDLSVVDLAHNGTPAAAIELRRRFWRAEARDALRKVGVSDPTIAMVDRYVVELEIASLADMTAELNAMTLSEGAVSA